MWIRQTLLAMIGLSAGMIVAGGLFAFIISLGIISDFADRTHTGNQIKLYEDAVALGGAIGNAIYIYKIPLGYHPIGLGVYGACAGIFIGCWAMALAEVLKIFPIFIRRIKIVQAIPYLILATALGKGIGALIYFWKGW